MAVQIIASIILFQSWTGVAAEEAAIPSDNNFVDELVSELGFQPADLIERIRQLSNIPSEAAMQHRLSYCVQGYPTGSRLMQNCVRRWRPKSRREHVRSLAYAEGATSSEQINIRYTRSCYAWLRVKCVPRKWAHFKVSRSMSSSWSLNTLLQ